MGKVRKPDTNLPVCIKLSTTLTGDDFSMAKLIEFQFLVFLVKEFEINYISMWELAKKWHFLFGNLDLKEYL